MQIVILAAGKGTRMNHLTADCPKPMLPILGKPKLAYTLETLPKEIDEVIFVVGYLQNAIKEYFGDSFASKSIRYVEQKNLNGTGGAVMLVKDIVKSPFLVIMGDDLYDREDLEKMMTYQLAILGSEEKNPQGKGVILTDGEGNLVSVKENYQGSSPALINAAAYTLNEQFFAAVPVSANNGHSEEIGLPQTLASIAKDTPVAVVRATRWLQITSPEDLEKAQKKIEAFI